MAYSIMPKRTKKFPYIVDILVGKSKIDRHYFKNKKDAMKKYRQAIYKGKLLAYTDYTKF